MLKKDTIQIIIILIMLVGIASFAVVDHMNISPFKANALVNNHVQKEYNLTEQEIIITNTTSNAKNIVEDFFLMISGQEVYTIDVFFESKNKTYNMSYNVNANDGKITKL